MVVVHVSHHDGVDVHHVQAGELRGRRLIRTGVHEHGRRPLLHENRVSLAHVQKVDFQLRQRDGRQEQERKDDENTLK